MAVSNLNQLWHEITVAQPAAPRWLVLTAASLALATVAYRPVWRVARNAVTIAHEGGHALAALLTGRRLGGVRVFRSTAGVTLSAGRASGPGIIATLAAGYLAPPLLGLGAAVLLATGHLLSLLLLSLAALIGLAIAVRNVYGLLAVLTTGAVIGFVLWRGSVVAEAALGYAMTWFLLLGGIRPVLELQRARRRDPVGRTDADQLAQLTGLPGWLWVGLFAVAGLAALAVSAALLVGPWAG